MTRISFGLAFALLAAGASAHSPEIVVTSDTRAHVAYADLDLHSSAGQAQLTGRIRAAAASLCNDPNIEPLNVHLKRLECFRVAVADGVSQMDHLANR